jgi:hypothetical protein
MQDIHLFSIVEEFCTLFLCCKICKISSDVWLHYADVRKEAQRRKACSAGAASSAGWGTPATTTATTAPDDHRADVSNADSGSSSHRSDSGRHSAAAVATTTSASDASEMPRDKRAEFMRGHPPTFAHSSDPMDAEDWLRTVERELHTAQCDDREKVLYGPRLLRGATQSWWESYLATHANPDTITWEEFRNNFRQYHVPAGLMTVKKEEFLALKQGPMSVSEYRDKFLQLSRYAPEDVNTDAKRQYWFLRGLVDPLQYQLMNHTFPTFQHLIDRAIMTERKRKEMEDRKRKIGGPRPRSSNRPRFWGNPPQQFRQNQRPPQQQQFQRQYPQHQQ